MFTNTLAQLLSRAKWYVNNIILHERYEVTFVPSLWFDWPLANSKFRYLKALSKTIWGTSLKKCLTAPVAQNNSRDIIKRDVTTWLFQISKLNNHIKFGVKRL